MSTTLAFIVAGTIGLLTGVGWLISVFGRAKYEQGKKDAIVLENAKQTIAKARADAVLAEHRDPTDVDKRLRDGTF